MTNTETSITLSASDETKSAFESVNRSLAELSNKAAQTGNATTSAFSGLSGSVRSAFQNASYQITDFVVQVQGGTSAARAMGQQLPQLLAGFGAFGAAAGVVAGFSPQIIEFFKSSNVVKPFADSLKDLDGALAGVANATATFDMKHLYEEFNGANSAARLGIVSLLEYKKTLTDVSATLSESSLSKDLKDIASMGTLDKIFGGDKAVDIAKKLGVEIGVARDLMADARSGVNESTLLAERYASALAKGSDKGRELAATLVAAAKGSRDAAAAQSAISEAMAKIKKAGATGVIPIGNKSETSKEVDDYTRLINSLNEKIALQTADLMSVEKLTAAEKDYAKYQADIASGAVNLTASQKAVADSFFEVYRARNKANELDKANKTADTITGDYARQNAQTIERIERESELALMTDRQRQVAEALYRAEDGGAAVRARIIHDVQDETAQKIALGKAEEELAAQKGRVSDATARAFDDQRSFGFGWTKAFQAYSDGAKNAASGATEFFNKAASSMEDAMVQFAMTGKTSFSSLANSIISDIIRMQSRAAVSGIMDKVSSLLGSYFGGSSSSSTGLSSLPASVNKTYALGGVESSASLSAYSGGIYSSPQLFKFAHGAGVFGEAGPEAIMPLKRGSDGKLGVSSNGDRGEVTVIINNQSGGQANQTQRTDGRGNKIIEVIIEQAKNAIASDISMGNGAVPAAMAGAFGLQRRPGAY